MRTLGRLLAVAVVAALASVAGATSALAHATYKSSNPADESTVSSAPSQITAEFTEPMSSQSYMDVTDPCGQDSGSGSSQTGSSMSVQNSSAAAGTYSVFWLAESIDSHVTKGTFTFTVTDGDPCPGEEPEEDPGTTTGGGGGTGGSASRGGGSDTSDDGGGASASAAAGTGSDSDNHSERHSGEHGGKDDRRGGRNKTDNDKDGADGTSLAADSGPDAPEPPSALEGIPVGGLLFTLVVAAFIGAAAGKIYVSLSGD